MMTMALMTGLEAGFLVVAAKQTGDGVLYRMVLVNMLLITLFGGIVAVIRGVHVNYGDIWYVGVVAAQGLLLARSGWRAGAYSVGATLGTLVFAVLAMLIVSTGHLVTPLWDVTVSAINFSAASFAAFAIGQAVMIATWRKMSDAPLWVRYGVSLTLCQLVDSAVFFPLAFWQGAPDDLLSLALGGCAIKAALGWLSVPLVNALHRP
jgi:uncharacterized PurR-regulated membrane protein YhhQ (DUF165 family)